MLIISSLHDYSRRKRHMDGSATAMIWDRLAKAMRTKGR